MSVSWVSYSYNTWHDIPVSYVYYPDGWYMTYMYHSNEWYTWHTHDTHMVHDTLMYHMNHMCVMCIEWLIHDLHIPFKWMIPITHIWYIWYMTWHTCPTCVSIKWMIHDIHLSFIWYTWHTYDTYDTHTIHMIDMCIHMGTIWIHISTFCVWHDRHISFICVWHTAYDVNTHMNTHMNIIHMCIHMCIHVICGMSYTPYQRSVTISTFCVWHTLIWMLCVWHTACDMTHWYGGRDSFIRVIWLLYVWHDSFMCDMTHAIHVCHVMCIIHLDDMCMSWIIYLNDTGIIHVCHVIICVSCTCIIRNICVTWHTCIIHMNDT